MTTPPNGQTVVEVELSDIIDSLSSQVAQKASEIAMLQAQLASVRRRAAAHEATHSEPSAE